MGLGSALRARARALPWLAAGALLMPPLWLAYRAYRSERIGFQSQRRATQPEPSTLGIEALRGVRFGQSRGLYGVFADPSNGACVVLAHGSMSDHTSLLAEAQILARGGFGVLALDFPGHGGSDGAIVWGANERAALSAALDFASKQPGVDPKRLGLYGFSMGGYIAAQVAASDPRVRAAAVAGTPADAREHTLYEYRRWGFVTQWPALLALRVSGMRLGELEPRQVVANIAPRQLLLVAGELDEHVPPWMTRQLYEAAQQPKRLVVVPGAGHGSYAEASPAYSQALLSFFEEALL
jgi:dipeptidyl aminopeptidase/acylaminoacyl peptidase